MNEPATQTQKKKITFIWGSINFIYRINFIRSHFTFLMNSCTRRTCSSAHCTVHCALAMLMWSIINNLCYTIFDVYFKFVLVSHLIRSHYYLCSDWCDAVIDDPSSNIDTHTHLATVRWLCAQHAYICAIHLMWNGTAKSWRCAHVNDRYFAVEWNKATNSHHLNVEMFVFG